jgi:ribosome-binding factor A
MVSRRSHRVAGLLKAEISDIIRARIKDPLVGFVTVTEVVLTADLRIARVYFTVLGDDEQKQDSIKGLQRASTFIQNELSSRVHLRYLPSLEFYYDDSWVYGSNIDRILHDLNKPHQSTESKS